MKVRLALFLLFASLSIPCVSKEKIDSSMCALDVACLIGDRLVKEKPFAYKLIRQMNEELEAKGFITIAGRVSRKYYEEKFYGMAQGVRTSSHTPVAVAK